MDLFTECSWLHMSDLHILHALILLFLLFWISAMQQKRYKVDYEHEEKFDKNPMQLRGKQQI